MKKGFKKGAKTPLDILADLDPELLDIANSLSDEQINEKIAYYAKADVELREMEKNDQDLAELKEKLKIAREIYTEGKKANKARIEFLRDVLVGRGKA